MSPTNLFLRVKDKHRHLKIFVDIDIEIPVNLLTNMLGIALLIAIKFLL